MSSDSRIKGFYKLSLEERVQLLKDIAGLSDADIQAFTRGLDLATANKMIENVVGMTQLPVGIATNFRVNGKDRLVPMAIEEPSVVAAASNAAKMALPEGFTAVSTRPVMRGQMQVLCVKDIPGTIKTICTLKGELIEKANAFADILPSIGGGVIDVGTRCIGPDEDRMLVVEFFVDCRDAMGANTVNTVVEGMTPEIERITGGKALLRIISNLATERMAKANVRYSEKAIGEGVADAVVNAYKFALYDPYRAATHNKGIMNGISAMTLALGNDTRAIEAGAHSYAALSGKYRPLSRWWKNENGDLEGELELPLAFGIVGGATRTHPVAQFCLKVLGVKTAKELAEVACAVGLAQNFAALRALATEGIQRGHMALHARNIAIIAGAKGDMVDKVAEQLVKERKVNVTRATEILNALRKG